MKNNTKRIVVAFRLAGEPGRRKLDGFRRYNERDENLLGGNKTFKDFRILPHKIRIAVCVNEKTHFHISASTMRISARALSVSGSSSHVPASFANDSL
jgi:sulfite reductase beta subunit-like hemoprotein